MAAVEFEIWQFEPDEDPFKVGGAPVLEIARDLLRSMPYRGNGREIGWQILHRKNDGTASLLLWWGEPANPSRDPWSRGIEIPDYAPEDL